MNDIPELTALPDGTYRATDDHRGVVGVLNNLCLRFPGSVDVAPDLGRSRYNVDELGIWDERISEKWAKDGSRPGWEYSQLRLSQTNREFFAAIDRAVCEAGIALESIKEANLALGRLTGKAWAEEYEKKFLPIYIVLRKKGYSRRDLAI
ncbi:MAG TPA: hypothetical protein VGE35_00530 [Candidatus Paceibacterota bacterium]